MTEATTAVDTAAVPKKNDPADGSVDAKLVGRLVEQVPNESEICTQTRHSVTNSSPGGR